MIEREYLIKILCLYNKHKEDMNKLYFECDLLYEKYKDIFHNAYCWHNYPALALAADCRNLIYNLPKKELFKIL